MDVRHTSHHLREQANAFVPHNFCSTARALAKPVVQAEVAQLHLNEQAKARSANDIVGGAYHTPRVFVCVE
jgi:hypothetical protein